MRFVPSVPLKAVLWLLVCPAVFVASTVQGQTQTQTQSQTQAHASKSKQNVQPAKAAAASGGAAQIWTPVGPAQILTQNYGAVTGRVTSLAVDPSDATGNTVVLGTAGGGVWRSVNAAGAGAAFVPLTDTLLVFNNGEATASVAVGAVTAEPGGTGVVLAGTGEARPVADAHYGEGLLRSADKGQTWALVQGSQDGAGGNHSFTGEGFAGFAWGTGNNVAAAVGQAGGAAQVGAVTLGASVRGLYGSQDAGQTWQLATIEDTASGSPQIVQGPDTNYGGYDGNSALAVVWNPLRQMFYAMVQYHGVYSSPDGLMWTRLLNQPGAGLAASAGLCPTNPGFGASGACPVAAAALVVNPATGDMFAWYVDGNNNDQGMWQDGCGAQSGICTDAVTFSEQIVTVALENGAGQVSDGASGLVLAALPALQGTNTTLLAGADTLVWCNLNTGCAWQQGCAASVQPGIRALATVNATQQAYLGSEGGLWQVSGAGGACAASSVVNLNAGLGPLAQLVSIAGNSADAGALLAGSAALGTAGTVSAPPWSASTVVATAWGQLDAGLGEDVALDAAGGVAYATAGTGVQIARCTAGVDCGPGEFSVAIGATQVENDEALAQTPYGLDPQNAGQMLVGTCRVWRGPATGAGWPAANVLSPMFDEDQQSSCNGNTLVRSVGAGGPVAGEQSTSQVIYAGMQGLALNQYGVLTPNAGHLFVTEDAQNANGTIPWTDISLSTVTNGGAGGSAFNAQQFDVSSVVVDPHDPTGATVYATIHGSHVPHVYASTNFGAQWLNVSANLPDVPASAVVVDPNDANTVYVALDTGVYYTQQIAQCPQQDCWQVYGAGLPNAVVTALEADGGSVGLLRAATYGRGAWEIPLATGALASETTATLSATLLTFAPQQVSTVSAPLAITVTVAGVNPLTATSISTSGDFSETDNCVGATVAAGQSCGVQVVFSPPVTGARAGTLVIYGNLPGGQAGPVQLSGTGLTAPQIVLSPSGALNFGDEPVGQTTAQQLVEVENTGQSAAALSSFNVTGSFAISANTCGATLAGQTGCSVGITFTPTARGVQTGTFTVTDTAGTQELALAGTGEALASLSMSPTALAFPSTQIGQTAAAETITVTNSGDISATVTGVAASGDFGVSNNGCGQSVAGNSSCTVGVTFAPTQAGARTGVLTVMTGAQTLTASLSGTGVGTPVLTLTPGTLNFGNENLQQTSAPQTMVLSNTGNGPDTVTGITTQTATAGTMDYAAVSNCGTLAPGASCSIQVTFTPSVSGPDAGTLTVQASVEGSSVTAALSGSGNTVAWTPGQQPAATVPSGQTANYALQLQVVGYSGAVTLSCSGLPAAAVCQLPGNVTVSGSAQAASVMFTVATGPDTVAAANRKHGGMVLAFCVPGLLLLGIRRRNARLAAVLMMLAGMAGMLGCGASSGSAGGSAGSASTPAGTYMFTVTASGGGMSSILPVELKVE